MRKQLINAALLMATVGLTVQCQQPQQQGSETEQTETQTGELTETPAADTTLYAVLEPVGALSLQQDSLMIGFTVVNPTADTLEFTVYHTPFEGFISKFLTVTDSAGQEVNYQGAMAKRVTPPPADTYRTVAPGQREQVTFDLRKGYAIEQPGTYTLQYNSERISGIANGEPLTITVVE